MVKEDLATQFDQKLWPNLTTIAEDFHTAVIHKLQSENPTTATQNSLSLLKPSKRSEYRSDETQNHNAIENQETNSVEIAFAKRPISPENFKIHQDRDVNGPKKCIDFVHNKYRQSHSFIVDQNSEHIECSNSADELYCICREPYDDKDKSTTKKMFQCEGPCQKWVHPSCFGETEENIINFEKNGIPYYCSFCRKDVPPEMLKMLKQKHAER